MTDYARLSDAELISRCLEQDAEAWEVLVRRYQRLIASITFKYKLSREDAADILQSVCFTLFQQLPSLRKQDKLSSWIITVAARECWKFTRQKVRTDSFDDPEQERILDLADEASVLADDSLLEIERQHFIRRAVESLADQCRQLIEQLFFRDEPLAYTEISRQLGMPVASIGPTRARCLEKLKSGLQKIGFF